MLHNASSTVSGDFDAKQTVMFLADQRQIRQKIKRDRFLKVNKYFVIIETKSCSLKLEHPQNCEASI